MRIKYIIAALLLLTAPAYAQTGSVKTLTQLNTEINTQFPDNATGAITPFVFRQLQLDLAASGVLIGQPIGVLSPNTGAFTSITANPTPSSLNNGLVITQALAGSTTTYTPVNRLLIASDSVSATTAAGGIVGFDLADLITGNDQGFRSAQQIELRRTGAANASNVLYQDVGLGTAFNGESNNNGTGGSPKGAGYAMYASASLFNNATNWFVLSGGEYDLGVATGSSAAVQIGLRIAHTGIHAIKGTTLDSALDFGSSTGAVGWDALITADNVGGDYPLATTGTFIRTLGSQTFANGVDMSSATISGSFLKGPSSTFIVSGTGVITGVGTNVTGVPISTGLTGTGTGVLTALSINTGTAGSFLVNGASIPLVTMGWSVTAPTVASGFCSTGSPVTALSASNGTAAFDILIGAATCGSTGTLTMPAATTGWVCHATDVTTPASHNVVQTGTNGSTTAVVFTDYSRTAGTAQNFTAGDHIHVMCAAY